MNVKLTPTKPLPERPAYDVSVNGKVIGLVEPYHHDEWHAQLKIPTGNAYPDHFLVQGFGATAEAAIQEAFDKGMDEHTLAVALIGEAYAAAKGIEESINTPENRGNA